MTAIEPDDLDPEALEAAARAMFEADGRAAFMWDRWREHYRRLARAALAAVQTADRQRVQVTWRDCDCEWATKFCDDNHVKQAMVPRAALGGGR